jgi:hypothetical protein
MTLMWAAIAAAVLLFLFAVGIPYWLSQRRLHPRAHADADAYLEAREHAAEDEVPDQPAHSARHVSTGTQPIGQPKPEQDGPAGH